MDEKNYKNKNIFKSFLNKNKIKLFDHDTIPFFFLVM